MATPPDVRLCLSKKRWGRLERAQKAVKKASQVGRNLRPYRCPLCCGWHLTSRLVERHEVQDDDDR